MGRLRSRAADDGMLRGKGRRISFFDEMTSQEGGTRSPYRDYCGWFEAEDAARIQHKAQQAEALFRTTGITFNVYGAADGDERLIPFDVVPRIISASEWRRLSRGIEQRVRALNAFLYDIYHRQEILRAGRVPTELIAGNEAFLPMMMGLDPPGGIYTHISGIDIVRKGCVPYSCEVNDDPFLSFHVYPFSTSRLGAVYIHRLEMPSDIRNFENRKKHCNKHQNSRNN